MGAWGLSQNLSGHCQVSAVGAPAVGRLRSSGQGAVFPSVSLITATSLLSFLFLLWNSSHLGLQICDLLPHHVYLTYSCSIFCNMSPLDMSGHGFCPQQDCPLFYSICSILNLKIVLCLGKMVFVMQKVLLSSSC